MKNDLLYRISLFVLVLVVVSPLMFMRIVTIDSDHVGIKYGRQRGDIAECGGRVIYNSITTDVYVYPTVKNVSYDAISLVSADGIIFKAYPKITYRIDSPVDFFKNRLCVFDHEKLYMKPESYEEFENGYMRSCITLAYSKVAHQYSLDSLMRYNWKFLEDVNSELNSFKEDCVSVDLVQTSFNPPKDWLAAKELLKKAEEEVEMRQKELEKELAKQTMMKKMVEGNI